MLYVTRAPWPAAAIHPLRHEVVCPLYFRATYFEHRKIDRTLQLMPELPLLLYDH